MDQENTSVGDTPVEAGGAAQQVVQESPRGPESNQNTEWKNRILREKKDLQRKLEEANQKLQANAGQRLQEQGKLEEYNAHLENRVKDLESKLIDERTTYAHRSLSERFRSEALSLGCSKPDALMKLADMNKITMNDDLTVDPISVQLHMEEMRKSYPEFFKTPAIPVKDGTPAATLKPAQEAVNKPKEKSHLEMTDAEFNEAFRQGMKG